eukprot:gene11140-3962_t
MSCCSDKKDKFSKEIANLVENLTNTFKENERVDPEELYKLMSNSQVSLKDLEPYAYFTETCYARNLIFENDDYSLILLAWNPLSSSAVHAHANSQCWAKVCCNEVTEIIYDDLESRKIIKSTTCKAGSILYIDDNLGVHRLANETEKPSLTLHCYHPPIRSCDFYCPVKNISGVCSMSYFSIDAKPKNDQYLKYKL